MAHLFDELRLGSLVLPNRIIMAPLTRMRSKQPGNIPYELNREYYEQRASAGLIITEATQISPAGQGYPATPGIHSREQVEGWKKVTEAVHQRGGRITLQLWHVGRISHSSFQPDGGAPLAPSAIAPKGKTMTAQWKQVPFETPRAMTLEQITSTINDYVTAAKNAQQAGFDGVEVHAANGYLLDQFLQSGSNTRTDQYGGSAENRSRFLLEVVDAVTRVWGADRVGVRISPYGTFNDMQDDAPVALFEYVLTQLSAKHIAYAHIIEPRATNAGGSDEVSVGMPETKALFRNAFKGVLISAGGYSPAEAKKAVEEGKADAVAFGRLFIANPDLPKRIELDAPLNRYDRSTFYGGEAKGYTDYPFLAQGPIA